MLYNMYLTLAAATLPTKSTTRPSDPTLTDVTQPVLQEVHELIAKFRQQPVTPVGTQEFEQTLQDRLREMGRVATQWTYNHLEPATAPESPMHVDLPATLYTRCHRPTPQNVWTLFGQIRLRRLGYRPTEKNGGATIFPLAMGLGLLQGASPALASRMGRLLGGTGMNQNQVRDRLREENGVGWGVKKLRQLSQALSEHLSEHRQEVQVQKVLGWLEEAAKSRGRHKPVLSVGRDGVTLGIRTKGQSIPEVASTGTVSVMNRSGKRLGTVYLACIPESGQGTMTKQLTSLLRAILSEYSGCDVRLSYVTDAGDSETAYYDKVLRTMRHPRTNKPLVWVRVVDYYHASTRIWTMAKVLFGEGQRSNSWALKMLKLLKKPGGVYRVLHSVVAFRDQMGLAGEALKELNTAYRYLRTRMPFMDYAGYGRKGVPLGSGVTEAACKAVFAQRLKLSGMRWTKAGAQTILNLRILLLSGVWDAAYTRMLKDGKQPQVWGQGHSAPAQSNRAA